MGLRHRRPGHKRLNDTDPSWDLRDGLDPQIPQWLFVQLFADPPDPASDYDEAAEAPEPDRDRLNALRNVWDALSRQECYVLIQHVVFGEAYASIAKTAWPRLRDARHARQIERRALAKLKNRMKYYKG